MVSCFVFSPWFVIEMLDLELYRSDLDATMMTPGSIDPIDTIRNVLGWLRDSRASQVSRLHRFELADFYRFDFDSSTSMSTSNVSIWMLCRSDRWP